MVLVLLKDQKYECPPGKVKDILNSLGLNLEEYVATKDGEILFDDDYIESGVIKLIPVISGG